MDNKIKNMTVVIQFENDKFQQVCLTDEQKQAILNLIALTTKDNSIIVDKVTIKKFKIL